jgi:hypothetical protein
VALPLNEKHSRPETWDFRTSSQLKTSAARSDFTLNRFMASRAAPRRRPDMFLRGWLSASSECHKSVIQLLAKRRKIVKKK